MRAKMLTAVAMLMLAVPVLAADKKPAESIQLEIKGTVTTGLVAIGGETTGVRIATKDGFSCELMGVMDDKLNKKTCVVTGTYAVKPGVEVKQRAILTVDKISEAKEKPEENYVKVKMVGKLATGVKAPGGATTGITLTASGVTWELDLGKKEDLAKLAEKLNGKLAEAEGTLEVVKAAAAPPRPRYVVKVAELKAVEEK